MRTESNKTSGFLPAIPLKDLLYRSSQIVIAKLSKHAPEEGERQLMSLQKRLLRRVWEWPVERRPTGHAAHRKHLQLAALAGYIGVCFIQSTSASTPQS